MGHVLDQSNNQPNVNGIIKKHLPLLSHDPVLSQLFPAGSIRVACKRESNLKDLLLRADPYNIKNDLVDHSEKGYVGCGQKCDSCDNFVDVTPHVKCFATGRKFKVRSNFTCSTPNVIYVAYCTLCGKQGVGSTTSWKPRLANYKSHVKKKKATCRIVSHFIGDCSNPSLEHLRFILVDAVVNTEGLTQSEVDGLLLKKEKFWIGTLVTQHKGLNGTHDWSRKLRWEKEK